MTIGDVKELGIPIKCWKASSHGIIVTEVPEDSMGFFFGVRPLMALVAVNGQVVDSLARLEKILNGDDTEDDEQLGSLAENSAVAVGASEQAATGSGGGGGGRKSSLAKFKQVAKKGTARKQSGVRQQLLARTTSQIMAQSTVLRFRGVCLQLEDLQDEQAVRHKIDLKYKKVHAESSGAAKVLDIVRASITCANEKQVLSVMKLLKNDITIKVSGWGVYT